MNLTGTPRLPIWFLGSSSFLYQLKKSQSSGKRKLYFQVTFSLPSPLCALGERRLQNLTWEFDLLLAL